MNLHFWGLGGHAKVGGGTTLADISSFAADVAHVVGERLTYEAGNAAKIGSYARREQEWTYQSNLAAGEITQIWKQIRAAEIREAIAELELKNHRQQMANADAITHFLNEEAKDKSGKTTNKAFYVWMKREVKGLYAQCFQFAFDIAKRAERALQHELGNPDASFLQFGYLAGKEGLLAGERLFLDIKRMEMAYHDLNAREYELTKHVSLQQVDPMMLLQLRTTGSCTVSLPESLFDMDGPGHYFRRIKTVAVSIPSVTGPYASVNCTLSLLKSRIRITSVAGDTYVRQGDEDARFNDHFGGVQSIVTSSAQNDSGLFETNLHDERFLPFENCGVISDWQLQLPANPANKEPCAFDYNTISDVILHIRYTAREGGKLLRKQATDSLGEVKNLVRLFSVRHEFSSQWAQFKSVTPDANHRAKLTLPLRPEHYPFWAQGLLEDAVVQDVNIFASGANTEKVTIFAHDVDPQQLDPLQDELGPDSSLKGLLFGKLDKVAPPKKLETTIELFFDNNTMTDLWIAVAWSGASPK